MHIKYSFGKKKAGLTILGTPRTNRGWGCVENRNHLGASSREGELEGRAMHAHF